MSSAEPPSPRTWAMLATGIALASSAVTLAGVLGVQRLHRRRMRLDLEDDVRRTLNRQSRSSSSERQKDAVDAEKAEEESMGASASSARAITSKTPRYLATLAAQESSSRTSTPRPSTNVSRQSTTSSASANAHIPRASTPTGPRQSSSLAKRNQAPSRTLEYDESLIREQLSRNYSFLGEEAMDKLRNAFVIVVGAGGVGSWCALMLLRSGVGRLRLIDFDQVSLSSLNRHACATLADVGRPKVQVCKERFAEIAPWCDVEARVEIFRGNDAPRLLAPAKVDPSQGLSQTVPTFVVDCIDNLDTKVDLLAYCYHHKIPCFSSMGAGAKADPSQIQVADLNTTAEDPLARRVRRSLRSKGVWGGGVMAKRRKGKKENAEAKKKKDQEEALKKLEAGMGRKKLEHSGRGADEAGGSNGLSSRRTSKQQMPPNSRRTSSTSSAGSVYFSPSSTTPTEEESANEEGEKEATLRGFRLPEAVDFDKANDASEAVNEENERDASPRRPPLATLQEPHSGSASASASRRPSSLAELSAEEMRTNGARSSSGLNLSTHAEEEEEDEGEDEIEDEQKGERPYTIMCVYTNEKSDTRLLPLDDEEFKKGDVDELAALEDFRVRILPVLGPLPAMFGLAAATYIICDIAGRQLEPLPFKGRRKTAERLFTELETSERRYPSPGSKMSSAEMALGPRRSPWSVEDVAYIFEEVFRCRSVVPPHETLAMGRMLRWDSTLPLSYSNVALFSRGEGQKHEEQVLKLGRSPIEVWGEETSHMFKRRMAEERRMNNLR